MKQITAAQFESEVLRAEVPVLLDFFTEDCSPCRHMNPILADIELEIASLKILKIDASADAQLSASFSVRTVPTFILFNRGQQIGQITGVRSKKAMAQWIGESIRAIP